MSELVSKIRREKSLKKLLIFVAVLSCFLAVFSWAAELKVYNTGLKADGAAYVPGELLVKYKPPVRAAASEHFRSRWGVSTLRSFRNIGVQHVKLPKELVLTGLAFVSSVLFAVVYRVPDIEVFAIPAFLIAAVWIDAAARRRRAQA